MNGIYRWALTSLVVLLGAYLEICFQDILPLLLGLCLHLDGLDRRHYGLAFRLFDLYEGIALFLECLSDDVDTVVIVLLHVVEDLLRLPIGLRLVFHLVLTIITITVALYIVTVE